MFGRAARRASTRSGGLVQQRVRHSPWWRGDRTSLRLPRGPGERAARGAKSGHSCRPGRKARCLEASPRCAGRRRAGGQAPAALCARSGKRHAREPRRRTQCFEIIAQYLFSFFSRGLAPFEICARLRRAPGAVRLVRRALPADRAPWPWGRWAEGLSAPWSARPGWLGQARLHRIFPG